MQELEDLINVLASTIGFLTNPPKIEATFKSTIQSAFSMPTEEKRIQEKAPLINIKDSFKKIIESYAIFTTACKLENLCSFLAILFIFFVIYFFSDILCCRVPLVLLRFAAFGKSVLVTSIRKTQKMGKNGELENLDFYEFRADTRAFSQGH